MINGEETQRAYILGFTSCYLKEEDWGSQELFLILIGVAVALGICRKIELVKHSVSSLLKLKMVWAETTHMCDLCVDRAFKVLRS